MLNFAESLLRAGLDAVIESARQRELEKLVEWARASDSECRQLRKQLESAHKKVSAAEDRACKAERRNQDLERHLCAEEQDALYEETLRKSLCLAVNILLEEAHAGYAGQPGSLSEPGESFRLIALIREIQIHTLQRTIGERTRAGKMTEQSETTFNEYLNQLKATRERLFRRIDRNQRYSILRMAKEQTNQLVASDFWRDFYKSLSPPKSG